MALKDYEIDSLQKSFSEARNELNKWDDDQVEKLISCLMAKKWSDSEIHEKFYYLCVSISALNQLLDEI